MKVLRLEITDSEITKAGQDNRYDNNYLVRAGIEGSLHGVSAWQKEIVTDTDLAVNIMIFGKILSLLGKQVYSLSYMRWNDTGRYYLETSREFLKKQKDAVFEQVEKIESHFSPSTNSVIYHVFPKRKQELRHDK